MKKILFGLVLVMCGEPCINIALQLLIPFLDVIGLLMPIVGLFLATIGVLEKE